MVNFNEGERTKPIRVIEYGRHTQAPIPFVIQAQDIFWEKRGDDDIGGTRLFSQFARDLAQRYMPEKVGGVSEYAHPLDVHLAFSNFGLMAGDIVRQLAWVLVAANGDILGKRILDLGCGSTGGSLDADAGYHGIFAPWLARTLIELGANPVGIDFGNLQGEKFEGHTVDLLKPDSLNFLGDSSIDIVHSRALFTSPQLHELQNSRWGYVSQSDSASRFFELLRPQIARILKPGGTFVYSKDL